MKENIKWAILGVCLIITVFVYTRGTRYQAVATSSGGFSQVVIYDRITGERK
jgi:uncharacterized membrane protein YjgN (DUF898 family)